MIMDTEEFFNLAMEGFLRKGGVMLAANDDAHAVGVRGPIEDVAEYFTRALVEMSVIIIKKSPEDFEILIAAAVSHLLAAAKIAEIKYDVPNLSENMVHRVMGALRDKDVARYATLSVKHMMDEMEKKA